MDDIASVWAEHVELELRHKRPRKALELLRRATATNFTGAASWNASTGPLRERLWRSTRLWGFYADLSESCCSLRATQLVYDRMIHRAPFKGMGSADCAAVRCEELRRPAV